MNREALKSAYKQTKRPMGVYGISNSQNKIVFVGTSMDLNARFNRHKAELMFGNHRNKELQGLWDSLGGPAFEFKTLDVLELVEDSQTTPQKELPVLLELWVQRLEDTGVTVRCI